MPEHDPHIAVAEFGNWGRNLVRNFHVLGALAAVTDTNEMLAGELAVEHDSVSRPWEDVFADPAIDGVVLATPAEAHAKMAEVALLYKGVILEDGVFCGPSCVFTNVINPRAEIERKDEFRPTLVKRGSTIGTNATIIYGATLGEYSFIAAGAVVTGDVPALALMAGVPAHRIGWMSHAGVRLGDDLVYPEKGRKYREREAGALEEIIEKQQPKETQRE